MITPVARLEDLLDAALRPYEQRPPAEEVAGIIAGLALCGDYLRVAVGLIPAEHRSPRAASAVEEWEHAIARGPQGDEPTDAWNYARSLARGAQALTAALAEHDSAARPDQHAHLGGDPQCHPMRDGNR